MRSCYQIIEQSHLQYFSKKAPIPCLVKKSFVSHRADYSFPFFFSALSLWQFIIRYERFPLFLGQPGPVIQFNWQVNFKWVRTDSKLLK